LQLAYWALSPLVLCFWRSSAAPSGGSVTSNIRTYKG
jgi:hypothetical protein